MIFKPFKNSRYLVANTGQVYSTTSSKFLKHIDDGHGYAAVTLWIDGVSEKFKVHRLVAEVFLGPAAPDMTVNHKDHDKRNNHVNNLEWVTQSDNTKAAWAAGRMNIGEDVVFSKLKNTDVIAIKHAMVEGLNNQ